MWVRYETHQLAKLKRVQRETKIAIKPTAVTKEKKKKVAVAAQPATDANQPKMNSSIFNSSYSYIDKGWANPVKPQITDIEDDEELLDYSGNFWTSKAS